MKNLHNILLSIIVILLIVIIYCICNNKKSDTVTSLSAGQSGKSRTSCNWACYKYNDQCKSTQRPDGLCDWTYIPREPRPMP